MFKFSTPQEHVQNVNAASAAAAAAAATAATSMGLWSDTKSQESEVHVVQTPNADHTGNNEEPSQGLSSTRPPAKVEEVMRMLREERERRCRLGISRLSSDKC